MADDRADGERTRLIDRALKHRHAQDSSSTNRNPRPNNDFSSLSGVSGAQLGAGAVIAALDVGAVCTVKASGKAVLFTGRALFKCCLAWGFEFIPLPDEETRVRVLGIEVSSSVVSVRILSHPQRRLVNMVGTTKAEWLRQSGTAEPFAPRVAPAEVGAEASVRFSAILDEKYEFPGNVSGLGPGPPMGTPLKRQPGSSSLGSSSMHAVITAAPGCSRAAPPEAKAPHSIASPGRSEAGSAGSSGGRHATRPRLPASLPPGEVPFHLLVQLFEAVTARVGSYTALTSLLLGGGLRRTVSGEALRALAQGHVNPRGLPAQLLTKLASVEVHSGTIFIHFMTRESLVVTMPPSDDWVLVSKHPSDPLLVHPLNEPLVVRSEPRKFTVRPTLRIKLGKHGIDKVVSGDIRLNSFLNLNVQIRMTDRPGVVAKDPSGRPYIATEGEGAASKPLVRGGKYEYQTHDQWLIVSVFGFSTEFGLPRLVSP